MPSSPLHPGIWVGLDLHILLHMDTQFPQHAFLRRLSSHKVHFGIFVKTEMALAAWVYIWVLYSIALHACFCSRTILVLLLWLCCILASRCGGSILLLRVALLGIFAAFIWYF